eukprot:scaffold105484_cov28-Tisochrysis_lutea.AAC.2
MHELVACNDVVYLLAPSAARSHACAHGGDFPATASGTTMPDNGLVGSAICSYSSAEPSRPHSLRNRLRSSNSSTWKARRTTTYLVKTGPVYSLPATSSARIISVCPSPFSRAFCSAIRFSR